MGRTVKVAGVQLAARPDVERTTKRALEMLALAASRGAQIAVLPELWAYPWFVGQLENDARRLAQPADGPLLAAMREKAATHKMMLVVPFFEIDKENGNAYNSAAVIDDKGKLSGVYRKMHLPQIPGWEEKSFFTPGDKGFCLFDSPAGPLGVQLGWDLMFPEGLRLLALGGANLVVAPMAVPAANDDLWERAVLTGAFANGLWLCRVGRAGAENGTTFAGRSLCATPTGDLLDEPMSDAEGVCIWEIDPRATPLVRRNWPFLRDRRPDQYGALSAPKKDEA